MSGIKAIAGNVVTLVGAATHGVTNAEVVQNPTHNGASYATKTDLAFYAKGIHNDQPEARFTVKQGANELTVAVDASGTKCRGNSANFGNTTSALKYSRPSRFSVSTAGAW